MLPHTIPHQLSSGANAFQIAALERGVGGRVGGEKMRKIEHTQLLFVSQTLFLTQQASHPMKHDEHEVLYKEDNYKGI